MLRAKPFSAVTVIRTCILWRVNIMNFLLWDFLSHLVTSSRSSPAFSPHTFVSVTISLCIFTGLALSFHTCSKEKIVFYSEWLNAVKSPLVKVSWSEVFMHCSLNIHMFYFIPPPQLFRTPHSIYILFSACISWYIFLVHVDLRELWYSGIK